MEATLVVGLVVLGVAVAALALRGRKRGDSEAFLLMQGQIEALRGQVSTSLTEGIGAVNQRLDSSGASMAKTIDAMEARIRDVLDKSSKQMASGAAETAKSVVDVQRRLGELSEASKRIMDVGKSMSELQTILSSPKLRGGLGETMLEKMLAEVLPGEHYELQHSFANGSMVDAVVNLAQGKLLPIDSKFPIDDFQRYARADQIQRPALFKEFARAVKKQIDDVAAKYILPAEGTLDVAFIYIPAENVYYEMLLKHDELPNGETLAAYGLRKKVVLVSPNSFYAYLQAILMGLKGLKVEKHARQIMAGVAALDVAVERFRDGFEKLDTHIHNLQSAYVAAQKGLMQLERRIEEMSPATIEGDAAPKLPDAPESPDA